ncbi:muts domain V-domain-containing protein [Globomyces pollinis-pini]|nr:muts domain V-domain-containing protein [Globomyces pollinis-pini]
MSIVSFEIHQNQLGISYYSDHVLSLMFPISITEQQDLVKIVSLIRLQTQPAFILLSSRSDQTIRDAVNGQNDLTSPFTMELRSALDFKFSNSLQKIQNLGSTVLNIQSHIDSLLNVNENCVSIASAGAILAHLTDLDQLDIHQCEVIHLNFHMQLSAETYCSLSIFNKKSHPNMHSNKERDHSSLFQLLNQTKSPVGNQLMKSWFMKPLQNLNDIQSRQSLISFFNHPHNNHLIKELQRHLSDTPNLPMLMSRIRMKNNPSDWKLFYKFLSSTIKICSIFMDVSSTDFELLQFFQLESIQTILNRLYQAVDFRIDFQSPESDRITIKSNVDVTLDEMKRFYQGLDSFLSELADNLQLPTIPASEFNLLYYPQLGFLISIGFPTDLKDAFEIDGLTFQFMDQNRGFYKNEVMFDLDAQFGDIHSNIVDLELELLQVLRDEIFEHYHQLISISKRLAELDCIVSLSFVAGNFGYCKPEMVHDNCILLEKSRHPIVERHLDNNFIANDVEIGEGNENRNLFKSLIITGPNSSGKSVYLQQVALIVFMAHLGSFVPCDKAIIGITDKILVRLSASSSVLSNQSSFYHDLNQARACIFDSTPKSLVIMDEFGKGTIPSDGIGLFCAIIKHLCGRTKLIACTHFHEISMFNLLENLPNLWFFTLAISTVGTETEFLYQIQAGQCQSSLGILCASKAGLSTKILNRATSISNSILNGDPIPRLDTDKSRDLLVLKMYDLFESLDFDSADIQHDLWRHLRPYQDYF